LEIIPKILLKTSGFTGKSINLVIMEDLDEKKREQMLKVATSILDRTAEIKE
jgi:hypothetical protein